MHPKLGRPAFLFTLFCFWPGTPARATPKPKQAVIRLPIANPSQDKASVKDIAVSFEGGDYVVRIGFDRDPTTVGCKPKCPEVLVLLDTDNDRATGLDLGPAKREGGADLALFVQVLASERKGKKPTVTARAVVRQVPNGATRLDEASRVAELNSVEDSERLQVDGPNLFVLIDASDPSIPHASEFRVVYRPPKSPPRQATAPMTAAHETVPAPVRVEGTKSPL